MENSWSNKAKYFPSFNMEIVSSLKTCYTYNSLK